MKHGTKILALLLALMMCISLFPTAAFAEDEDEDAGTIALVEEPETAEDPAGEVAIAPEEESEDLPPADGTDAVVSGQCGDNLTWSFNSSTGVLYISGTGDMWNWDSMESPWYSYCDEIAWIFLPEDGPTSIGDRAFEMCSSLQYVQIPTCVRSIGDYAFAYCTSLKMIDFIGSAPGIGEHAFAGVTAMAYYPANDDTWTEEVRQDYGGDIAWPVASPDQCGDNLYWSLDEETGVLTITGSGDMWDWYRWSLTPWARVGIDITAVELPDGLTSIGNFAFIFEGSLKAIEIPASVTRIGHYACYGCRSLTRVEIPAGVTSIGHAAFGGGGITEIIVAEENEDYRSVDGILYSKDMTTLIQCPGGKTGEVVIPDTVTSIGSHEKVEGISFGDGPAIYAGAFTGCTSLTSVTIPEGVTSIGEWTFGSCSSLKNVTLPETLTSIGDGAFYSCHSLASITIPAGVTSLGGSLFIDSGNSLHTIRFEGSAPNIVESAFYGVTATAYYPANDETWTEEVRQQYNGTLTWKEYDARFNPFQDVKLGKYYYDPVLWAYYHEPQITSGTGDASFSPNQTCTRGQIVTFLWNAAGAPEPAVTENPFVDVTEDKYYYKAVLWAVENGITGGMDATHFGPKEICTREQVVTFLWSAAGKPEPTATSKPFADVKEGKYYCKAVLWALENGVTSGMSETSFGVGVPCTRGQVVTFLYAAKDLLGY